MGGGAEEERQAHVVPCLDPIPNRRRHEMASLPIPDELLADIFLRLPSPADLARTSATCVSFRRVTADRSFLRRYRKRHARPLLGFFDKDKVFYPAIAPHPSASAASAVALTAFSFSFLPAPSRTWVVNDTRSGRVLLYRSCHHGTNVFPLEFVVCDPLHRRYLLLPRIAVAGNLPVSSVCSADLFLVPPRGGDEAAAAQETSFRVVWMALCMTRELLVFVFSSNTGQWQAIPSQHLFAGLPPLGCIFYSLQYVYGCFYSVIYCGEAFKVLVLNTETMELSIAEAPLEAKSSHDFAMVEAGEGRPGMFVLGADTSDLSYFIRQNDGQSSSQWQKVKTISLGSETSLICNMEKYLLLHQTQSSLLEAGCFTLDIENFKLEKVCALGSKFRKLHAYSNFPPSLLSSPTISSGIQEDDVKPMLEQDAEVLTAEAQSHHDHTTDVSAGGQAGVSRIRDGAD